MTYVTHLDRFLCSLAKQGRTDLHLLAARRVLGARAGGRAVILPKFLIVAALRAAYVHFGGLGWMTAIFYGVSLR